MNIDTGEIKEFDKNTLEQLKEDWIRISEKDMTDKQRKNKKVSLKDNKSKLGKQLTAERKKRGYF